MGVNVREARRDNVDWLIRAKYGSQTSLANALGHILTQQNLSEIHRNKKGMLSNKARKIEQILVIPNGWMDRKNWIRDGSELIKKYQKLGKEERVTADSLSAFVLERLTADIYSDKPLGELNA